MVRVIKKALFGTVLVVGALAVLSVGAVVMTGLWITYVVERKLPGGVR